MTAGLVQEMLAAGARSHREGKIDEAERLYRQVLAVEPAHAAALYHLGLIRRGQRRFGEAAACFERALRSEPNFTAALSELGLTFLDLDRQEDGEACLEKALLLDPNSVEIHYNLGVAQLVSGRIAKARHHFESAVAIAPGRPACLRLLAQTRKFTVDDPYLGAMQTLERDIGSLGEDDRIDLHFALGKAYDDIGDVESAFRHLLAGNALKRRRIAYDERSTLAELEQIRAMFTSKLIEANQGAGDPSTVPVFVVGMPRSGTTLLEQVLASHPQVFGAGEIDDFGQAMRKLGPAGLALSDTEPSAEALRRLGGFYVSSLRSRSPDAVRVVDKTTNNFRFVGLIRMALPHARIIHMRRDPIDTCLSCFSRLFADDSQNYSYDLGELGRYYRAYQRLMDHWRSILPGDAVLDVSYEALTQNLEEEARRVVAYCGLDLDDSCLAFHEAQRPVRTASATQVRQPIYRSSVGRRRPSDESLRPLLDALTAAQA